MAKVLIIFLTLLPALICTAQAVVWNEGMSGELHWGETMFLDNYSLNLADFSIEEGHTCSVLVQLQADNLTIVRRALQAGEWFEWNDSVRVSVQQIVVGDIQDDPLAVIGLQLPAAADLSLIVSGDRESYQGGDEMRIQLQIENKGIVDAENLRIELVSMPPFLNERYSISTVGAGKIWDKKKDTHEIDNLKINIKAPYFPKPTNLVLQASARYTDPDGTAYESGGGSIFHISGPVQLHKIVEETQEFQESYYVINSLRNTGNRTLDMELSDSTGSGFRSEESLNWKFNLSPGEAKTISYLIGARQPGLGQVLPSAVVSYRWDDNSYTIRSEMPVVDVFGPSIEAERRISPKKLQPGEIATVSVKLTNLGNKQAAIALQDEVLGETELVSGSVNSSIILAPNETCSKEYRLRCLKEGTVRIPSREISYRDVRGNEYHASMQALEIDVQGKKKSNLNNGNLSKSNLNNGNLSKSNLGKSNTVERNSNDDALNVAGKSGAQNVAEKAGAQAEKGDWQMEKSASRIGDEDGVEGSGEEYLPALLITIILLLYAAISKYL
ncbi:MAG TPA: hypothetical protein PKK68_09500 [Methanothrix soehngenii]|mgnify:CR=1 FL=1|nr:hypothetical protein [Methanothrix soehngenii]